MRTSSDLTSTPGDWAALVAAMRATQPEAAKRHTKLKPQHRKQVRKAFLLAGGWASPDPVASYAEATLAYYRERRARLDRQQRENQVEKYLARGMCPTCGQAVAQ